MSSGVVAEEASSSDDAERNEDSEVAEDSEVVAEGCAWMGCGATAAWLGGVALPNADEDGDVNQEWARIWGIVIRLMGSFCSIL
jgi:hypothetical protein